MRVTLSWNKASVPTLAALFLNFCQANDGFILDHISARVQKPHPKHWCPSTCQHSNTGDGKGLQGTKETEGYRARRQKVDTEKHMQSCIHQILLLGIHLCMCAKCPEILCAPWGVLGEGLYSYIQNLCDGYLYYFTFVCVVCTLEIIHMYHDTLNVLSRYRLCQSQGFCSMFCPCLAIYYIGSMLTAPIKFLFGGNTSLPHPHPPAILHGASQFNTVCTSCHV